MSTNFISHSEKDTEEYAEKFVFELKQGIVIGLYGDLGSGKTFFVRAASHALGSRDIVTSPTFVLRQEYRGTHSIIKRIIHIDLYRLERVKKNEDFLEDIKRNDTLTFIEWPQKLLDTSLLYCTLTFEIIDESTRKIIF